MYATRYYPEQASQLQVGDKIGVYFHRSYDAFKHGEVVRRTPKQITVRINAAQQEVFRIGEYKVTNVKANRWHDNAELVAAEDVDAYIARKAAEAERHKMIREVEAKLGRVPHLNITELTQLNALLDSFQA